MRRSLRALALVVTPLAGCEVLSGEADPADGPSPGSPGENGGSSGAPAPGAPQAGCKIATECNSSICTAGKCAAATPTDGVKNDDESDVDCGGAKAPKCVPLKRCKAPTDCDSSVCTSGACVAASPTDGVLNGGETDIDCGGPNAPKCARGKTCVAHADCASDGCGYDHQCSLARSCTPHFGGDTCGPGEIGEPGTKHESCCTSIPIAGGKRLDKFTITSGRMRAFVERFKGDIRGFVSALGTNPNWDKAWTPRMPSNMEELNVDLGPYGVNDSRQGCWMKGQGARTYWMPDDVNQTAFDDEIPQKYGKDVLDTKALNCTEFYMLQAFCIWDGTRLATIEELDKEWGGTFPWGNEPLTTDRAVFNFTYGWPEDRLDNTAYVAAPGRKPLGNSPSGVADLGGLLFNITSTLNPTGARWSRNGSWEVHAVPYGVHSSPKERGYEAAGGRCVRN